MVDAVSLQIDLLPLYHIGKFNFVALENGEKYS